jgi:hypothetical protein
MYCCLPFSYAVKYGIVKVDTERIEVKLSLKPDPNLSETEKERISDTLYNNHIINLDPDLDFLYIIHCPFCGVHMNTVIDFDKSIHAGQYSSKENWER